MKKVKKIRFHRDKDGNDRTIKGNRLMSKKDIITILDFYCNHNDKITTILKKRSIKYRYDKIKLLIQNYKKILKIRNGILPANYLDALYYGINKKHLLKEETNQFIVEKLQ